jgi:hypothetical protein
MAYAAPMTVCLQRTLTSRHTKKVQQFTVLRDKVLYNEWHTDA